MERKTPLNEDLLIISNHFMSQLNLKGYFTAFVFVDGFKKAGPKTRRRRLAEGYDGVDEGDKARHRADARGHAKID